MHTKLLKIANNKNSESKKKLRHWNGTVVNRHATLQMQGHLKLRIQSLLKFRFNKKTYLRLSLPLSLSLSKLRELCRSLSLKNKSLNGLMLNFQKTLHLDRDNSRIPAVVHEVRNPPVTFSKNWKKNLLKIIMDISFIYDPTQFFRIP